MILITRIKNESYTSVLSSFHHVLEFLKEGQTVKGSQLTIPLFLNPKSYVYYFVTKKNYQLVWKPFFFLSAIKYLLY